MSWDGRIISAERQYRMALKLRERLRRPDSRRSHISTEELARRLAAAKKRIGPSPWPDSDPPGWRESMRAHTGVGFYDRWTDRMTKFQLWRGTIGDQAEPPPAQTDDGS